MAEPHVYGRSIVQPIRAFAGPDQAVAIHSLVSARLYRNPPSEAQQQDYAETQGGFVQAVNTFSATDATELVYTVTFDAVNDPEPTSGALYDYWHVVANVRFESGGQPQSIYRQILLWRPTGQFSQLDVSDDDVYEIEHEIETRFGDVRTKAKISRAKKRVMTRLASKDLDLARVREQDLSEPVIYLAASMCLRDMATQGNEDYRAKADYYAAEYEAIWASLKIGYADGENSAVEPESKVNTGIRGLRVRI